MGLRRLERGDEAVEGFVHLGSYAGAGLTVLLGLVVLAVPLLL